ncbi:MAG: YdeI/OmpD-associated family protein [Patescibacteria group bacterium]
MKATTKKEISTGVVHKVPEDLQKVINLAKATRATWEDITPLARNEWICWIESAKKPETRSHRIERARTGLIEGKRRPCCWAGCIHRSKRNIFKILSK